MGWLQDAEDKVQDNAPAITQAAGAYYGAPAVGIAGMAGMGGGAGGGLGGILGGLGGNDSASKAGLGGFTSQTYDINPAAFTDTTRSNALRDQFARGLVDSHDRGFFAGEVPANSNVQFDMGAQNQTRGAQNGALAQYQNMAAGNGPSLAQNQLQQGVEGNIRAAMAQGTSHPGMNPALAQRSIANQMAGANQAQALNAAQLRSQEQMGALSGLSGLSGQMRGQDISAAQAHAQTGLANQGMNQQANIANQQAKIQALTENDAMARYYNTATAEQDAQDRMAKMQLEKLKADQIAGVNSTNAASFAGQQERTGNFIGGMGKAIAGAFSDEDVKKKVREAGTDIERALSEYSLAPHPVPDYSKGGGGGDDKKGYGGFFDTMKGSKNTNSVGGATSTGSVSDSGFSGDSGGSGGGMGGMGGDMAYAACGGIVPHKYADGGPVSKLAYGLMKDGGKIPGKAKMDGDSEDNDTVPAMLSPGEVVLPRSVAKEAVENPDSDKLKNFLDVLGSHKYEYKNPEIHGQGERISPMAQELEKSDLGKQMVSDTPVGKMVDYGKGLGFMLAAQAHNHKRLGDLETAFKKMADGGKVSFADAKDDDDYQKHAGNIKNAFSFVPSAPADEAPKKDEESIWDKFKKKLAE